MAYDDPLLILPDAVLCRHASITAACEVTWKGSKAYLGWSSLILNKVWLDTETNSRVIYLGGSASAQKIYNGFAARRNINEADLAMVEQIGKVLPGWVTRAHGSISKWEYVTLDHKKGYLGISSFLYSKLWFDTEEESVTIVTGSQQECLDMYAQLLEIAKQHALIHDSDDLPADLQDFLECDEPLSPVCVTINGNFTLDPRKPLSDVTLPLIEKAFRGLGSAPVYDFHAHCVGVQKDVTGCCVHSDAFSWLHPVNKIKQMLFMKGLGVKDLTSSTIDYEMVHRLSLLNDGIAKLLPSQSMKTILLPFDAVYTEDGKLDSKRTALYVPNDHVISECRKYPGMIAACSIHPYRKDAVTALRRCRDAGVRLVKWLPNSQFFDPSSPRCTPFYEAMRELSMTLLCHVGGESSLTFCGTDDELGNPLLIRKALGKGVRVILAHCASEGTAVDLDDEKKPRVPCFDLFLRLMRDPKYEGLLFADVSALTNFARLPCFVRVLDQPSIHHRLVYGSDYPVPCTPMVVQFGKMAEAGLLAPTDVQILEHIKDANPVLANFVAMRLAASPHTGNTLPASVFHGMPSLLGEDENLINERFMSMAE
eukprot:TRINITY_DN25104_c0_g1_i1.p1 TRINITY_DN25104_c0_g1~~TRINITY_DN25104_c0_g1_i1.p1  ORF type:complete len:608 (+),score=201.05 TRINITY_DN25104_c0_g1_i1:40-1824(+)